MAYLDCNQAKDIPRQASRRKSVYRDAGNARSTLSRASRVSEDKASDGTEVQDHKYSGDELRARRFSTTSASRPAEEPEVHTLPFVPFELEDAQPTEYLDGGFGWIIVASMSKTVERVRESSAHYPLLKARLSSHSTFWVISMAGA